MTRSKELIAELVHRYADAVVHKDRQQWASCWAPDAHWDLGGGRRADGLEAIVAHWEESLEKIEMVVQTVFTGEVRTTLKRGEGRWYITEHLRRRNGDVGLLLAYYDDTYVRIGRRWLFSSRRLTALYHGPPDLSAPFRAP
jgi:SnoaL-like domain